MVFCKLVKEVRNHWPLLIYWRSKSELVQAEENISEKMIGLKDELLYRELSYSLMIYLSGKDCPKSGQLFDDIDFNQVKNLFERRISAWKEEDDDFSSDVAARERYFSDNI